MVDLLVERSKQVIVGPGSKPGIGVSPVTHRDLYNRIH